MNQPYKLIPYINLLPEEYRRRPLSLLHVALVFILLLELSIGYLSFQAAAVTKAEISSLQMQLDRLTQHYETIRPEVEKLLALRSQLEKLKVERERIKSGYQALAPPDILWGSLISHVLRSIPQGIMLDSVIQKEAELTLKGSSPSPEAVSSYIQELGRSPSISRVSLQTLLIQKEASPPSYSFTLKLILQEKE